MFVQVYLWQIDGDLLSGRLSPARLLSTSDQLLFRNKHTENMSTPVSYVFHICSHHSTELPVHGSSKGNDMNQFTTVTENYKKNNIHNFNNFRNTMEEQENCFRVKQEEEWKRHNINNTFNMYNSSDLNLSLVVFNPPHKRLVNVGQRSPEGCFWNDQREGQSGQMFGRGEVCWA